MLKDIKKTWDIWLSHVFFLILQQNLKLMNYVSLGI